MSANQTETLTRLWSANKLPTGGVTGDGLLYRSQYERWLNMHRGKYSQWLQGTEESQRLRNTRYIDNVSVQPSLQNVSRKRGQESRLKATFAIAIAKKVAQKMNCSESGANQEKPVVNVLSILIPPARKSLYTSSSQHHTKCSAVKASPIVDAHLLEAVGWSKHCL